jgi:hypothetical protein
MAQKAIRAIHWGQIFETLASAWRHRAGSLYAFWPSPLGADACFEAAGFSDFEGGDDDALDPEWQAVVERAIGFLELDYRSARQLRPDTAAVIPTPGLLQRILKLRGAEKPPSFPITDRVMMSTYDDQIPEAIVDFGPDGVVRMRASDGHRILWVSIAPNVAFDPGRFAYLLAEDRPISNTQLDWRKLMN